MRELEEQLRKRRTQVQSTDNSDGARRDVLAEHDNPVAQHLAARRALRHAALRRQDSGDLFVAVHAMEAFLAEGISVPAVLAANADF